MDATMDATRKANMMTKATKVMKAKPLSQTILWPALNGMRTVGSHGTCTQGGCLGGFE